jgi:hypothetical protein
LFFKELDCSNNKIQEAIQLCNSKISNLSTQLQIYYQQESNIKSANNNQPQFVQQQYHNHDKKFQSEPETTELQTNKKRNHTSLQDLTNKLHDEFNQCFDSIIPKLFSTNQVYKTLVNISQKYTGDHQYYKIQLENFDNPAFIISRNIKIDLDDVRCFLCALQLVNYLNTKPNFQELITIDNHIINRLFRVIVDAIGTYFQSIKDNFDDIQKIIGISQNIKTTIWILFEFADKFLKSLAIYFSVKDKQTTVRLFDRVEAILLALITFNNYLKQTDQSLDQQYNLIIINLHAFLLNHYQENVQQIQNSTSQEKEKTLQDRLEIFQQLSKDDTLKKGLTDEQYNRYQEVYQDAIKTYEENIKNTQ